MKIVVSDRNLLPHRTLFESKLPSHCEVSWHKNADESALSDDLADADVFVGGRFSAALASAAPQLRLVHVAGAGTDGIEFESLPTLFTTNGPSPNTSPQPPFSSAAGSCRRTANCERADGPPPCTTQPCSNRPHSARPPLAS